MNERVRDLWATSCPKSGLLEADRSRPAAVELQRVAEGWAGSGAEELVRWAGIAIEDEDAFVIERKLRGLPGNLGGIEGLGFLLLGPAEEGGLGK